MMEENFRFLDDLNQALRPPDDPEEIMAAATRMLGEYLGVDRCAYAEVEADEKYLEITNEYARADIPSIVGRFRVDDLGAEALRMMRTNRPFVVDDAEAGALAGRDLSAYRQAGARALMCAPSSKNGHYVARMAVSQKTPRQWKPWEIDLVAKVANRCWEAVQQAREVKGLRQSEERYRAFIANSSEAIWRYEMEQPNPINLPEDEQIEWAFKYAYLAECNDTMARFHGYETADQIIGARIGDLVVKSDPRNINQMRAFKRAGFKLTDSEMRHVDRFGNTKYFLTNLIGIVENGAVVRVWGTQRDITERKEAEQALRENEERYRLLTEISPDGVAIIGEDWTIHLANQSMQRMLGVAPEHVIGRNFCDFFPPRCAEKYCDCLVNLITGALPEDQIELAFRRDDGRLLPVEVSAAHFDWKGRRFAQLIIRDISQRKQAEAERERLHKEIEAERNRLKQILEQLPIGVFIVEAPSGRPIFCNHEAESVLRHPLLASDDYRGYAQYGALREDCSPYRAEDYPISRAIISGETVKGEEMRYRRGDGSETILSVDSAPISDSKGRRVLAVATFIDIAERKQAEKARRESEEHARRQLAYVEAIYATAPVGLCFVDTNLIYRSLNERLAEINGKPVKKHIGRTVREVLPDAADTLEPVFRHVIETGEPSMNIEQSVMTDAQPGVLRHFIASFYPIKNGGGRVLGVNAVVMEITERKKIEEERERLLREEKVLREEAEAANRMKDEFLATISHELRTPLTSILGWARMLTRGGLTTPQARHALEVIAQSAQSQTQLIEDILDTSRIITGRFKLDAQPVEIEHVFHAAVDVIKPSAEAKGIALSEVMEAPDGMVLGDDNRLRQAIWNLLSNAVKFTSKGGRIEARLGRAEGQIEITVKDTGIGIDPKFLPHVFDRFRQANASSTREYGGLGIGLAIVRHIVELHGGGILASSPGKGRGATFKIRLPLISGPRLERQEGTGVEPMPPAKERKILETSGRLDGARVLLVEDNPETLELLKFIFDEAGAEVITATSVDDALETLERFQPDALISDIAMPDRDGYDLIREVRSRELEQGGKIPAVAVTAYARAEDRMRLLAAGFQMHIAKPIVPDELIAVVASLTGHIDYGSIGVSGM
ncbi:MAG: PAS domain S-box protein [Blastocatellia bacterium]|nr:PAS domain S-box protein [Blastocatellia bacterium]